jgi:hypothetical protein
MDGNIRKFAEEKERVETGPVQFGDDWPGYFIRGDNAFALRLAIANILVNPNDVFARMQLHAIMEELDGCNENRKLVLDMQKEEKEISNGKTNG